MSPPVRTATLRWLVWSLDVAAPLAVMAHLVMAHGDVVAHRLAVTDPESALAKRPGYDIDLREEELDFPNTHDVFAGGCIPTPETHARVTYCPACRRAKASWLAAHPELSPLGNVRY